MNQSEEVELVDDELEEPEQETVAPRRWFPVGWFLLGVLIGAVTLAAVAIVAGWARPPLTSEAVQIAARQGTLDAIATLQAQSAPSQSPSGDSAPSAAPGSFTLRDANRVGNKNAPVTVVEFSDFQ